MGSSETVSYNDNSSYVGKTDAGVPTSRGAGARAMTGAQPGGYGSADVSVSSPSTTTTVVSPGDAFDTNLSTTKGAGARSLSGNDASAGVTTSSSVGGSETFGTSSTTTPGTVGGGPDASEATTKGAGARALSGNDAYPDTTSSVAAATDTSSTTTTVGTTGNLSRQDSTFVREAAQSGLAEVQMGNLVQQNAQSQQLKDFGQRLVTDHTRANEELMQIAQQKGITAPTTISAHDQHMMSKLSGLNGAEFDRMCQQDAVAAHEKAIKLFQTEAQSGQDAELKAFAQKTLPTLQEHLRMARQASGSSSSSLSTTTESSSQ